MKLRATKTVKEPNAYKTISRQTRIPVWFVLCLGAGMGSAILRLALHVFPPPQGRGDFGRKQASEPVSTTSSCFIEGNA